jgi:hypothetical protein
LSQIGETSKWRLQRQRMNRIRTSQVRFERFQEDAPVLFRRVAAMQRLMRDLVVSLLPVSALFFLSFT